MTRRSMDDKNYTFIDPNIIVFHNAIEDPAGAIDYYEETFPWKGWFGFGRSVDYSGPAFNGLKRFPTEEEWDQMMIIKEGTEGEIYDPYRNEIAWSFYDCSKIYFDRVKREMPNWTCEPWALARYIPDEDLVTSDEVSMNYHTDYQSERAESPGSKYAVTAVLYPNDDYEGGEISFKILDEDGNLTKTLDYKPKAGDFVFFPADHPYYHGVKRIWNEPKYIFRLYWRYEFEGTENWHNLRKKYGEVFENLEKERCSRTDIVIGQPILRNMYNISEYYDLLDQGLLKSKYLNENT